MKRILLLGIFCCTIAFEVNAQSCVQDSLFSASIAYRKEITSFNDWKKGTQFIIAYDEILKNASTQLLEYNVVPQPVPGGYKNAVPALAFKERILTLQQVDTVDNKIALIFECAGKKYKYISAKKRLEEVTLASLGNVTLLGAMDKMQALVDKTLYTKGGNWLTLKERAAIVAVPSVSFRYYPVTITRIEQDKFHQYYVYFRPVNEETEYFYVVGYETFLDGTSGEDVCQNRFDTQFSFCDPRASYKNISEKTWKKIQSMDIAEGMTEDEVRLIINKPDEESELVEKGKKYKCWVSLNYALERKYLIYFEKGKVKAVVSAAL